MNTRGGCVTILFAALLGTQGGFAQPADSNSTYLYLDARLHYGFVIVHSRDVRAVEDSYPWGVEVDMGWLNASEKSWNSCNCTPRIGLSLGFWDFDNRAILGHGATAQFFIEPEFGAHTTWSFSVRAGMGLSYQSRPHHPERNPDNLSYSTYFAFPLHVGLTLRHRISDKWQVQFSGRYNHISNGSIKQPNKGINWPTAALGISYFPIATHIPKHPKTDWRELDKPVSRLVLSAFGATQESKDNKRHLVAGIEARYSKQVARLNALSLGAEVLHHGRYPYMASINELSTHGWIFGAALGHEFLLGRFVFSQQMGAYLVKPTNEPRDLYQRYGLIYMLGDKWSLGVNLKTHGHIADFIDMRAGLAF